MADTETDAIAKEMHEAALVDGDGFPVDKADMLLLKGSVRIEALRAELSETKKELTDMETRALEAEAENARLSKWAALGEWVMAAWPELGDLDGFTLQELAVKAGVLQEIPGGYDPDHHFDSLGVEPERGEPWFEMIPRPTLPDEDT